MHICAYISGKEEGMGISGWVWKQTQCGVVCGIVVAGVKALVLTVIRASFVSYNVHTRMLKKILACLNNLFTIYYYNLFLKVEILNS